MALVHVLKDLISNIKNKDTKDGTTGMTKDGINNSWQISIREVLKSSQTLRHPPGFESGLDNHSGINYLGHRDSSYKLIRDLI